jgi:hypothetical protein
MKIDKKTIAIIILAILVAILSYIAYKPSVEVIGDNILKAEKERLEVENKTLFSEILTRDTIISKLKDEITDLENKKPKIKTIYVTIYKKIDTLNCTGVANEFKTVFANAGIK